MKIKTILLFIVVLLAAVPVLAGGWLVYHDGPYTGKIVDAETGQPIEGAVVLGIRQLVVTTIDTKLKYFDASEATTDKEGSFEVPAVTGFYWWPFARLGRTEFFIFKPGYDSYPPYDLMKPGITGMEQKGFLEKTDNIIRLKKLLTIEERKEVLTVVGFPLFHYSKQNISGKAKKLVTMTRDEKKYLGMPTGGK